MNIQKLFHRQNRPLQKLIRQAKRLGRKPQLQRRQKNLAMGSVLGGLLSTAIVALILPSLLKHNKGQHKKAQHKSGLMDNVHNQFESGLSQLKQQAQELKKNLHLESKTPVNANQNGHSIRTMGDV
ncbi:MAG: hypothetical protein ACO1RX_15915 [Candidatus Sericytochromatia bacterium]